jgi:hypothetical protein
MKIRTIALTIATCIAAATLCFASPLMGTWKLNEAKSKLAPGAPKNNMVTYETTGDNIKCTVDGVDAQGKPTRIEWTGKFDGKDYPLTGDPNGDMRSYKTIDARTTEGVTTKGGKAAVKSRIVVSADGKSRTVTSDATDSAGKKTHSMAYYDKQ